MKNSFNILLIAFLLVFASSCTKFTPLDRSDETGDSFMIKSGQDNDASTDTDASITDPEHDEDHDSDGGITDTDNDEDHDKDDTNRG